MDLVLFAVRLGLALTLAMSGLLKAFDRTGTAASAAGLGVPPRLAPVVAWVLPYAELAVAVALVIPASATVAAGTAAVLFLAFTVLVTVNVIRGRRIECHCFGASSEPIGWKTVARNVILCALATGVVLARGSAGEIARWQWLGSIPDTARISLGINLVLIVFLSVLAVVLLQTLRQHGRILSRLEALEGQPSRREPAMIPSPPVGSPAPDLPLRDLDGQEVLLSQSWRSGNPVLVAFVDPACGPCAGLLPHLATWARVETERLAITLISRGDTETNRAKYSGFGTLLLQKEWEVSLAYGALGTPSALIIDPNGVIRSPLATGVGPISELVAQTMRAPDTTHKSPASLL